MHIKGFRTRDFIAYALIAGAVYWLSLNFNFLPNWLHSFSSKLLPITLGAALAFVINIPTSYIEHKFFSINWGKYDSARKKVKRPLSLLLSLFFFGALIYAFFALLLPQINATLVRLSTQIPLTVARLTDQVENFLETKPQIREFAEANNIHLDDIARQFTLSYDKVIRSLISGISNIALNIISGFVTFLISLIFGIYIICGKEQIGREVTGLLYALFNEEKVDHFLKLMIFAGKMFARYIAAACMEAGILGFLVLVVMFLFDIPYYSMIAVLVALFALIPIFGAYISASLSFILILTVNVHKALLFLPLFFVVQQIEGNLIYPFVVGSQVGLPAIWVFAAVLIGGNFFGFPGLILSVPLSAVLYVVIKQYVKQSNEQRNIAVAKLHSAVEYFAVEKDVDALMRRDYNPTPFFTAIMNKHLPLPHLPHISLPYLTTNENMDKKSEEEQVKNPKTKKKRETGTDKTTPTNGPKDAGV